MSSARPASASPDESGPSTLQSLNTNKRALSEVEDVEGKDEKKMKRTVFEDDSERHGSKDRKKRRKKKRKMSVVAERHARIHDSTLDPLPSLSAQNVKSLDSASKNPNGALPRRKPTSSATQVSSKDGKSPDSDVQANLSASVSSAEGKTKANDSTPLSSQLDACPSSESPAEIIARLTKQLGDKNNLLSKHENALSQMQQSITCQICLDLMYKPYALAPCGHLACYECLVQWFKAPTVDGPAMPTLMSKKTCPHCRSMVNQRPVEVWAIKSMVNGLAKSDLLKGILPPPLDVIRAANDDGPAAPVDPWLGIFRKRFETEYQHPFFGFPMHPPPNPAHPPAQGADVGMYDAEDGGIYRCLDCMHEIWDGVCSSCGRVYTGHDDFGDEISDDEEFDGFQIGAEDAFNLDRFDFSQVILNRDSGAIFFRQDLDGEEQIDAQHRIQVVDETDQESDKDEDHSMGSEESASDEDDDSMGSFIDDDGAASSASGIVRDPYVIDPSDSDVGPRRRRQPLRRVVSSDAGSMIKLSDDENQDQDHTHRPTRPARVAGKSSAIVAPSDQRHDSRASGSSGPPFRGRRGRIVVVSSDVEGSESESRGQHSSHMARRSGHLEEEEDDDDEDDNDGGEIYLDYVATERDLYGEDDSIAGPPARLRHLFQHHADEDQHDESFGESWYGLEEGSMSG